MVGLIVGKSKSMFLISIIRLYLFSSLHSTDPGGTFIDIPPKLMGSIHI